MGLLAPTFFTPTRVGLAKGRGEDTTPTRVENRLTQEECSTEDLNYFPK